MKPTVFWIVYLSNQTWHASTIKHAESYHVSLLITRELLNVSKQRTTLVKQWTHSIII